MSKLGGFGVELEEMRTMVVIAAALIPAFSWVSRAPNGQRMAVRAALSGALVLGAVLLDTRLLRGTK